jgi:phage repressor protein C with HTH and peptisase S24 domain
MPESRTPQPSKAEPRKPTPAERLRLAMAEAGVDSASELARQAGLNEVTARSYVNGTRGITPEAAETLSRLLRCDAGWLMFGTGRPPGRSGIATAGLAAPETETFDDTLSGGVRPAPLPPRPDRVHKVPVLGTAQGGRDGTFEFNNGEPIDFVDRPSALTHRPRVYCIYVDGDSMAPAHLDGDLLFIDAGRKPFPGRDALIELNQESDGQPLRAFIKRVVKLTPEFIELLEFRPKERTFRLPRARIRNLHLVLKNTDMY